MILVDTSVWIDFMRGTGNTPSSALHALIADEADICLADVNMTEILRGVADDIAYRGIRRDLLRFSIIAPKGLETHLVAADIYRGCRRKGVTIRNSSDCLIAAIAMENDAVILHNDSDYDRIASVYPSLRIANPDFFLT